MGFRGLLGTIRGGSAGGRIRPGKPQQYRASFSVKLRNVLPERNAVSVVLPVPPHTDYQEITSAPKFSPESVTVEEENQFGNSYAVWQEVLKPGQEMSFQESFEVRVFPRVEKTEDGTWEEYEPLKKENPDLFSGTPLLCIDDPKIRDVAQKIKDRVEEAEPASVLREINQYVISHLEYGDPEEGLYSALDAIERDKVDCGGFDALFAALCLCVGIPARVVSGFWAGYKKKNEMHAWVEAMFPDGRWIPADPSVEQLRLAKRTKKEGRLGYVGPDRIVLSHGSDVAVRLGKKRVVLDILQNPYVEVEHGSNSVEVTKSFVTKKR